MLKRNLKKILVIILTLAVVAIVGLIIASFNKQYEDEAFSSYGTDRGGVKALFRLADDMDYRCLRLKKSVRFMPDGATLVVISPVSDFILDKTESKYMKEWLKRGNTLIYIGNDETLTEELKESLDSSYESHIDTYADWLLYRVGNGKLFINEDSSIFTNNGLKSDKGGQAFIDLLDQAENNIVYFDEYYHNIGSAGISIRDIIGVSGQMVFWQFVLGLVVFFIAISRRFGKPAVVFEIIKRKENENIFAVANILKKSKANSYVVEIMFNSLKKDMIKYLGIEPGSQSQEIKLAASNESYFSQMDIPGLFAKCEAYISSNEYDFKELTYLVKWIEKVREEIK